MAIGWEAASKLTVPLAARVETGLLYYVGLAVVVVFLVCALVAAYRHWEEMNDIEEPDLPADLLESFRQAHADGALDEEELDRVRRVLSAGERGTADIPVASPPNRPGDPMDVSQMPGEGPDPSAN